MGTQPRTHTSPQSSSACDSDLLQQRDRPRERHLLGKAGGSLAPRSSTGRLSCGQKAAGFRPLTLCTSATTALGTLDPRATYSCQNYLPASNEPQAGTQMATGPSPTASLRNTPRNTTRRPRVEARPQTAAVSPHDLLPMQTHTAVILSQPVTPDTANTAASNLEGITGPKQQAPAIQQGLRS